MNAETTIAIVAIVVGIVGVWWQNRHSRKLAQETGDLKQRSIGLFIGQHELRDREVWCYCFPEHEASRVCVVMKLLIFNKGGVTCDGVIVTINTVKDLLSTYRPKSGAPLFKVFPSVL